MHNCRVLVVFSSSFAVDQKYQVPKKSYLAKGKISQNRWSLGVFLTHSSLRFPQHLQLQWGSSGDLVWTTSTSSPLASKMSNVESPGLIGGSLLIFFLFFWYLDQSESVKLAFLLENIVFQLIWLKKMCFLKKTWCFWKTLFWQI